MVIARGTGGPGGELLIFGLSRENITRLLEGDPILIRRPTHGSSVPEGWSVAIFFGETELQMVETFRNLGLLCTQAEKIADPQPGPGVK